MSRVNIVFVGAAVRLVEADFAHVGAAVADVEADFRHCDADIPHSGAAVVRAEADVPLRAVGTPLFCKSLAPVGPHFKSCGTEIEPVGARIPHV
jgi:hypothetical protein